MNKLKLRQFFLTVAQTIVCTIILIFLGDLSWRVALGAAIAFSYIGQLRRDLDELQVSFRIADSELVRVSRLLSAAEDRLTDLEEEISRLHTHQD